MQAAGISAELHLLCYALHYCVTQAQAEQ